MRLATELPALGQRGAEAVALCVDPPERNAALVRRWRLPFPIVSDPGGGRWLQPLDLWNAGERGGIAVPSITLVLPDGEWAYHHRSRDFADRPDDGELIGRLAATGLPALDPAPPPWEPDAVPEDHPDAMRTGGWSMYMRGVRSASAALAARAGDGPAHQEATAMTRMAASFLAAWEQHREATGGP